MDATQIRSFTQRRWDLLDAEKLRCRARRHASLGPGGATVAAAALRERWHRLCGTTTEAAREEDFEHHLALVRKLERAAGVFARG